MNERREWSLPQASCSVTELLRHNQRHTFSASPKDFPLYEHLSNPTLFQQQRSRLANVSPDLTNLPTGEFTRDRKPQFASNVSCASRGRHQPADRICLNRRAIPHLAPHLTAGRLLQLLVPSFDHRKRQVSALRRDVRTPRRQDNQYGRDGWGDHYHDSRARCRRWCRMGLLQQAAS